MRVKVTSRWPLSAWATALPAMLLSVTEPLTSSMSSSPSTPVTTMSPSFTARRCREVWTGTEMLRSMARDKGLGVDVDLIVFLFDGKTGRGDGDALRAGFLARAFAVAGACFHDDFFSFVSLYGDAAVDETCLSRARDARDR